MICPNCGHDNLPGNEVCSNCEQDLTKLDRPMPQTAIERSLMEDPVRKLHPKPPLVVPHTATVHQAVQVMLNRNIGAVLVVDGARKLLGIFSERDLLTRIAGRYDNWGELPVIDFMTANPETIGPTDPLNFALHRMNIGGYRHLPVVEHGEPTGVISVRDMLRYITQPRQRR
jgi:CBS domain-containing protein